MNKFLLGVFMFFLMGCGPTQEKYDEVIKENIEVKAKLSEREKEILDLKKTPKELFDEAIIEKSKDGKINKLENLINRYPNSNEAMKSSRILSDMYVSIINSDSDSDKVKALSEYCDIDKLEKIPVSFKGTDISSVIDLYSNNLIEKDEFETSVEYEKRLSNYVKSLGREKQCIITNVYSKYDSDKQGWSLSLLDSELNRSYANFFIKRTTTPSGNYIGTNALGAKVSVNKTKEEYRGVYLNQAAFAKLHSNIGGSIGSYSNELFIPMSIDKAKIANIKNLKILIQYKWIPDYLKTFKREKYATYNNPQDKESSYELLTGYPLKIIIFNADTGEIIKSS